MAGARPIVDPPAFTPLPYGLWDSIQHPTAPDHWQNGVTWIERCFDGDATTYDECISVTGTGGPPPPDPKADNVLNRFRGATPITIYTKFDCSPVGIQDAQDAATEALDRNESFQLEYAFWTGLVGGQTLAFPHLAASAEVLDAEGIVLQIPTEIAITGVGTPNGLGLLEESLAECYAGQGLIHVPVSALPGLVAWNLVIERDGVLWTPRGNRIVVGGGYPNTSPSGIPALPGTAWIYATGPVFGYRGDVFFTRERDSFNRAENTIEMIAERTYVLGFECCLFAALISLDVPV